MWICTSIATVTVIVYETNGVSRRCTSIATVTVIVYETKGLLGVEMYFHSHSDCDCL